MTIGVGSIVVITNERSKYHSRFAFVYKAHKSGRLGVMLNGGQMVSYSRASLRAAPSTPPTHSPWKDDFERACKSCREYFVNPAKQRVSSSELADVPGQAGDEAGDESANSLQIQALQRVVEHLTNELSRFSIETASQIRSIHETVRSVSARQDMLSREETVQMQSVGSEDRNDDNMPDVVPNWT